MKKLQQGFIVPVAIVIIAVLAISGTAYFSGHKKADAPIVIDTNLPPQNATTTSIIGGDRDEHGCIGSAGYSWCEVKNKCLRTWEEKCEAVRTPSTTTEPLTPVACTMDAMMCPDGTYVGRSGPNCEFVCPNK